MIYIKNNEPTHYIMFIFYNSDKGKQYTGLLYIYIGLMHIPWVGTKKNKKDCGCLSADFIMLAAWNGITIRLLLEQKKESEFKKRGAASTRGML